MRRTVTIPAVALAMLTVVALAPAAFQAAPPAFQVDPFWPKPLPNHWLLGSVTGVAVDAQNHIWVVHRGAASMTARTEIGAATDPPTAEKCCIPAPFVLRFDPAGNVVSHWRGPGAGYTWPPSPGPIDVEVKGNIWMAAACQAVPIPGAVGRGATAPPPPPDACVLKFSSRRKFLLQIGKPGNVGDDSSTTSLP